MKKAELIEALTAELAEFTAMPMPFPQAESGVAKSKGEAKAYDAKKDKRIARLLRPVHFSGKKAPRYFDLVSLVMTSVLSSGGFSMPSTAQLKDLLALSGYSAAEMNAYQAELGNLCLSVFSGQHMLPVGMLFHRVLTDALTEARGKGTDAKNGKPVPSALERLRRTVAYMVKNDLLFLLVDTDCLTREATEEERRENEKAYRDFVLRHAVLECKRQILMTEIKNNMVQRRRRESAILQAGKQEFQKCLHRELRERKQTMLGKKTNGQTPFIQSEFRPELFQLPQFAQVTEGSLPFALSGGMEEDALDEWLRTLPEDRKAVVERVGKQMAELTQSDFEVLRQGAERFTELSQQEAVYMKCEEYAPEIVDSALFALLQGDEIFPLELGKKLYLCLAQEACFPGMSAVTPELEDEDEWDDLADPGKNEKLETMLVPEDEIILYPNPAASSGKPISSDTLMDIPNPVQLGTVISTYAGRWFVPPLTLRKSHVKAFRALGYSERKARDYAVIVATIQRMNQLETDSVAFDRCECYPTDGAAAAPQPVTEAEVDARLAEAQERVQTANRQKKTAELESQTCRHEMANLRREIERLKEELDQKKAELDRTTELMELYETMEEDAPSEDSSVVFPYRTSKKVILYGGFHSFHQEVERLLPDIRIIPYSAHIDLAPFRTADLVFLQINKTSHSNYWNIVDTAKAAGVPFYHLNYAGPERCAVEMVKKLQEL